MEKPSGGKPNISDHTPAEERFLSNINAINCLAEEEKRQTYARLIPGVILDRFHIPASFLDAQGNDLLAINGPCGNASVEMSLFHEHDFPDPILFGHITDTLSGQIHVLLYVINDPTSPRFDVDRLPDGTSTKFGTQHRNLEAETAALEYGLAPGQVRRGLRMLDPAIKSFEDFVTFLGHDMYFAEPLFYHNALIFERNGFSYQKGHLRMKQIDQGFRHGGALLQKLDGSTIFRQPGAQHSIRLRSWAIHDGILGEPFSDIVMYKRVGKPADVNTCGDCAW
jgi:hypothetical protein